MQRAIPKVAKWAGAMLFAAAAITVGIRTWTAHGRFQDRVYRIGWEPRLPFQETASDGSPTGLAIELVREAARRRGIRLEWSQEPRSSERSLREKAVDLWPLMVITPERRKVLHITEPYLEVNVGFLVSAGSRFRQSRDLDKATIAYFASPIWQQYLSSRFPGATLHVKPSLPGMLEGLCQESVDAVLMEEDLAIMSLLGGFSCKDTGSHPPLRLIPVPEIRPAMGVGSTFEAAGAADAIREEIGNIAVDDNLAAILSRGSYVSFRQMESFSGVLAARRRAHWLTAIAAGFAALLVLALWQASRIRREGHRARAAQRSAREAERKLRLMADNLKEMVLAYDMNRRLIYGNPAVEKITGYSLAELRAEGFICWVHPEDRARMLGYWDGLFQGNEYREQEYRLVSKHGPVKILNATWGPILDETGRQVGVQGSEFDVTEQRQLQTRLEEAVRMESIGRLAGGVAHDFNNLLTVINGYSGMLADELEPADPRHESAAEIRRAGDRAAALTRQLLAFSRRQIIAPVPLCLNDVVREAEMMLRRVIEENIELVMKLAPGLWLVTADAGQMHQVLMNLAVNARDAMPMGGRIAIETANVELDDSQTARHGLAKPGPHVRMVVADTGAGMTSEDVRHIFEPFFIARHLAAGTGLCLSTVYGIVRQSGGSISADSAPGKGSAFTILLPASAGSAQSSVSHGKAAESAAGGETILVVEDNPELRRFASTVLRRCGYRVLDAPDANAALEMAEAHREPLHVLLTDVVLPETAGKELADRLLQLHRETRCVYMSGYTADMIGCQGVLEAGTDFLPKPFTPEELAAKMRAVLARPPGTSSK